MLRIGHVGLEAITFAVSKNVDRRWRVRIDYGLYHAFCSQGPVAWASREKDKTAWFVARAHHWRSGFFSLQRRWWFRGRSVDGRFVAIKNFIQVDLEDTVVGRQSEDRILRIDVGEYSTGWYNVLAVSVISY